MDGVTDAPLINRAAVIRLYPNREQAGALRRWQGGIRKVCNETLDWCFKQREAGGKWPNQRAIQSFMVERNNPALSGSVASQLTPFWRLPRT